MLLKLKNIVENNIPEPLSKGLVKIPYSWRLGSKYKDTKSDITIFKKLNIQEQKEFIFKRMKNIVEYAFYNNRFYSDFYKKNQFHLEKLKDFSDIDRIPIISKKDLYNYDIELRSNAVKRRIRLNTGGTSGQPLEFYIDSKGFAREWAHMHEIWSKLGYKHTDLKLTFRGKNLGEDIVKYNVIHNEYIVNSYKNIVDIALAIESLLENKKVSYLHGYPSLIYNFALFISSNSPNLVELFRKQLKGIFLGSEYPAPIYRDVIEKTFEVPTLSWYGHSEMALLAYEEKEKFKYRPLQTYGYCEALDNGNGSFRLLGTSYDNIASPFIRYDTGDLIRPINIEDGMLKEFMIKEGRIGDFVIDSNGNRISLTSLIFGRHHDAFGSAKFIQVYQEKPGEITLYINPITNYVSDNINWSEKFDTSNLNIVFKYEEVENPFYTSSGKIPLLISKTSGYCR